MNKEQEQYFILRYKYKITDYKKVAETSEKLLDETMNTEEVKSRYAGKGGGIDQYMCDVINKKFNISIDRDDINSYRDFFEYYHEKYDRYNKDDNRKELFSDYGECMRWFEKENDSCHYCKITQDELYEIVKLRDGNLTLNKKQKRSKGVLEIEKLDPNKGYDDFDNLVLACPLCNNAKSNLISQDDWKDFFADSMKKYYKKLLDE